MFLSDLKNQIEFFVTIIGHAKYYAIKRQNKQTRTKHQRVDSPQSTTQLLCSPPRRFEKWQNIRNEMIRTPDISMCTPTALPLSYIRGKRLLVSSFEMPLRSRHSLQRVSVMFWKPTPGQVQVRPRNSTFISSVTEDRECKVTDMSCSKIVFLAWPKSRPQTNHISWQNHAFLSQRCYSNYHKWPKFLTKTYAQLRPKLQCCGIKMSTWPWLYHSFLVKVFTPFSFHTFFLVELPYN